MAMTFSLFVSLPKELQLTIWTFALQESRIVTILKKDRYFIPFPSTHVPEPKSTLYFFSPTPPPALTAACVDSRTIAKSIYTLAFVEGVIPHYIYVNFEIDTIIITDRDVFVASPEDRLAIRYLVMTVHDWFDHKEFLLWDDSSVVKMYGLKELTVVGQEGWRKWKDMEEDSFQGQLQRAFASESTWNRPDGLSLPKIIGLVEGDDGSFGAKLVEVTAFETPDRVVELMEAARLRDKLIAKLAVGGLGV